MDVVPGGLPRSGNNAAGSSCSWDDRGEPIAAVMNLWRSLMPAATGLAMTRCHARHHHPSSHALSWLHLAARHLVPCGAKRCEPGLLIGRQNLPRLYSAAGECDVCLDHVIGRLPQTRFVSLEIR